MQITDIVTITELSNLLGKSRPTVYKYVSDYESGNYSAIPHSVKSLFDKIMSGETSKRGVFEYCDHWFAGKAQSSASGEKPTTLKEVIKLLKDNERRLNLGKIKKYIEEELGR
ncbi:MAG: hypothetical protein IJW53_03525 [Clostridia bacterium]|nr:hypothetical protein [Clostridia bacterium]